ncbi:unnamed protein product, partial [marine sediment metagenome]
SQIINDSSAIHQLMAEQTENKMLKKLVPKIFSLLGIHSVILVPLTLPDEVIGLVDISSTEPFAQSDVHRVEILSGQLTSVIKRNR